jgi:hypothetical protein
MNLDLSQAGRIQNIEYEVKFLKQDNQLPKEQRSSHLEVLQERQQKRSEPNTRNKEVICWNDPSRAMMHNLFFKGPLWQSAFVYGPPDSSSLLWVAILELSLETKPRGFS